MRQDSFRFSHALRCGLAIVLFVSCQSLVRAQSGAVPTTSESELAAKMHKSLGTAKGLCVVLGSADGRLAVALSRDGQYLVHGLCTNGEAVGRARAFIAAVKLRGVVSAEQGSLARLPYSNNIVNLVVVEDVLAQLKDGLKVSEILRVLRPGGEAWLGLRLTDGKSMAGFLLSVNKAVLTDQATSKKMDGRWLCLVKSRPESMDAWTHARGSASGNPVSADTQIGVPTGVRWVAGPNWPTGNRKSSVPSAVASKQHLVYIFEDEVSTPDGPKLENSLIARDAYNGLRLWRRKSDSTELVSDSGLVYTKVGGKLVALDGETGKVVRTFAIERPGQFLLSEGLLIASRPGGITAVESKSGKVRWSSSHEPKRMRAGDGRLFVHVDRSRRGGDSSLACLELKAGKPLWEKPVKSWADQASFDLVFYSKGVLVTASKGGNHGVSADDGSHLWDYTYPRIGHGGSYSKVMATGGLVWVHSADSQGSGQYAWEGLDLKTGKLKQRLLQPKSFKIKHRCSYDVATGRVFLCGSMEIAEVATGKYTRFEASRTSCRTAGLVPANGLIYTFPHACGCYSMMRGFLALQTEPQAADLPPRSDDRLEEGPAYDGKQRILPVSTSDWPTYRHDIARSGSTSSPGPARLDRLWEQVVTDRVPEAVALEWGQRDGGRLSSPVVARGLVLVAASDEHRVRAFDARTGRPRWSFTAGGRIDCPPTIYSGLCLFGSHDGYVYCLVADTGELVWRLQATPRVRRIVAYGQVESARPVVGGVLVYEGLSYFLAGRHSDSDGGILVSAVEPGTGKLVWSSRVVGHVGPPDVLTGGKGTIQMASWEVDALTGKPRRGGQKRLRGGRLGLLNDAWYKRPIAIRRNLSQWSAGNRPPGQILAFNDRITCGYRACDKINTGNGVMTGQALLFATPLKGKEWGIAMANTSRVRGMALAGDRLYVAGKLYNDAEGKSVTVGARVYRLVNGTLLAEQVIEDQLVHDCLAVADGRLYVSTQDGRLLCLGNR